MNDDTLFIIPARGGSKGIPRKNIKPLGGRPLINYSIDVARALAHNDHIILSTDDNEIAEVAENAGLKVEYRRRAELATDTAGSREVILDAMDWADKHCITYDKVVLLQPTSPLRTVEDVRRGIELYDPSLDMVVSVVSARTNPYLNCYEIDPDTGMLVISKGDGCFTRRQDAPPVWEFNGAVYVINPESIRREPLGCFKKRKSFEMPMERSIDLDTTSDWIIAELMLSHKGKQIQ